MFHCARAGRAGGGGNGCPGAALALFLLAAAMAASFARPRDRARTGACCLLRAGIRVQVLAQLLELAVAGSRREHDHVRQVTRMVCGAMRWISVVAMC